MRIFNYLQVNVPIDQLEAYIQTHPGCVNTETMHTQENPRERIHEMHPLAYAVKYGTAEQVRCLLKNGANPNPDYRLDINIAPLWIAVTKPRPEVIELLITHGAKANQKYNHSFHNYSPLTQAIECSAETLHDPSLSENVKILLKYGANPNDNCKVFSSALEQAIQKKQTRAIKYLLKYGAKPVATTGVPILLIICRMIKSGDPQLDQDSIEILETLLDHGADPYLTRTWHDSEGYVQLTKDSFSNWLDVKMAHPATIEMKDQLHGLRGYMNFRQNNVILAIQDWLAISDLKTLSPKTNRVIGEILKSSSFLETAGFDFNELLAKSLRHLQADPHFTAEALLDALASEEKVDESAYDILCSSAREQDEKNVISEWNTLCSDKKPDPAFSLETLKEKKPSTSIIQEKKTSPLTKKIEKKIQQLGVKHKELQSLGWDKLNNEMKELHRYLIKRKAESGFFVRWSQDYKTRLTIFQKLWQLKRECEMLPPNQIADTRLILNRMGSYIISQLSRLSNKRCAEHLRDILKTILTIQKKQEEEKKALRVF